MNEDLNEILLTIAQQQATFHARLDAHQTVLISVVTALGQASKEGAEIIERYALLASEQLCANNEKKGVPEKQTSEYRHQMETILMTVRAALTGKAR